MTKRAVIYTRISSDDQDRGDRDSLADQESACRAVAEAQGWTIAAVYSDEFTGTKPMADRPEGSRLIASIEAGEIDGVFFHRLDRVGRTTRGILNDLHDLGERGVEIVVLKENVDTSTPTGKFALTLFAAFAQLDRDNIVERLGSAKYRRAKDGQWAGGTMPYGYRRAEDNRSIEAEASEMVAVERMYALRLAGLSVDDVARTIRTEGFRTRPRASKGGPKESRRWTAANIARLISQSVYYGSGLSFTLRRNPHDPDTAETFTMDAPAIVTMKEWTKANDRKGGERRFGGHSGDKSRNPYALKRRLYHRHPDGELVPMYPSTRSSGRKDGSKRREYLCRDARVRDGRQASCAGFGVIGKRDGKPQISTRAKADRVEAITLGYMLDLITDPDKLRRLQIQNDERRAALDINVEREDVERRLTKLASRRGFLLEQGASDAEAGRLDRPAFKTALAVVDEEADDLRAELKALDKQDAEVADVATMLAEILEGTVYGLPGSPEMAVGDEATRLSEEWVEALRADVATALTPGARGATPALSAFAIGETRWLAQSLGIVVVLSRNEGGFGVLDLDTGESILSDALGEQFSGLKPAAWPTVEVGIDPSLSGQGERLVKELGHRINVPHRLRPRSARQTVCAPCVDRSESVRIKHREPS
jgi:DNA invertase Pin-like site-specific DNA recombinase